MPRIFTIGYEGATVAGVLDALSNAGVTQLVDVRAVPQSRKPGFSKKSLSAALAERGIAYRHLQRLGTPAAGRDAARKGDIGAMRDIYLKHLEEPDAMAELAMLADAAAEAPSALLCFERLPGECHRSVLLERLGDFIPEHLFAALPGQPGG